MEHLISSPRSSGCLCKSQVSRGSLFLTSRSDSCALSLQPFKNPVAVIAKTIPTKSEQAPVVRADVFDLLNIVPYIRKFKTSESFLQHVRLTRQIL
jgi:peptidyl-prolyl cis-trans isomerase-like protein 2